MIVSHAHKYVFVQIPRTGCTAVAAELMANYEGESILGKHSSYSEGLATGSAPRGYSVLASVRNPLADIVAGYEKLRTNHEKYEDPDRHVSAPGGYVTDKMLAAFRFVQAHPDDFEQYVRTFHKLTYDHQISLDEGVYDHVMRFESLADDFSKWLAAAGIPAVRDLPLVNRTNRDKRDWIDYYDSESLQRFIAPRVLPFMRQWGYSLPSNWSEPNAVVSTVAGIAHRALAVRRRRIWAQPAASFDDGKQANASRPQTDDSA